MISLVAVSQETKPEEDVEKQSIYDVKLGVNLLRMGKTFFGSSIETQEFQVAIGTQKFDYVLDLGNETNTRAGNYSYNSNGSYFRVGVDRNFVKDRGSGNSLSLGMRYARASFEDALNYSLDNGFGLEEINLSNSDLTSRWLELTFNLRGKITSNLYSGFTLRWKFARNIQGEGDLKVYDIPGFGNTKRQNNTSFDYYVMWRVPFK